MIEEDFIEDEETEDDFLDLDAEKEEEEREIGLISASDDFMDHMEGTLNEHILDKQGITQVGSRFKFTGQDGIEYYLTMKEKLFAEGYLKHKGNAVDAVISAGYDVRKKDNQGQPINNVYNRKLASVIGYELLNKPHITSYLKNLYERYGFSDEAVEREHLFLINQNGDLKTKAKAIDMYYHRKALYPAKKLDLGDLGEGIIGITYVKPTDKQNTTTAESAGVEHSS